MNFKTTVILIIVLAAAGAYLFFTREKPAADQTQTAQAQNLLDISATDVNKITVAPADGTAFTLEKSNGNWKITTPVKAPAETFEVDSLVRAFTDTKTTGSLPAGADQSATGLDHPRDVVTLTTPSKTVTVNVGEASPVGGNLYVQVAGQSQVQMVAASDMNDRLTKGADAYRKMNLVSAAADQIKQITITTSATPKTPEQKIVLQKQGSTWEMVQPIQCTADDTAVSDLTYALTGLRADSFTSAHDIPPTATARPQMVVAYSTDAPPLPPPATQPTTQPTWTTITFGSPVDILNKSVYVTLSGSASNESPDAVAELATTSLDSFRKTPLDLRDKTIFNFDPNVVKAISLITELPAATQPTAHPASATTIALAKRLAASPLLGPAAPTTGQSATKPTTKPAVAQSKWIVASAHDASADDSKVTTLLDALHPLKADKFLATTPTTQPAGSYTLTITTTGPFGSNIAEHTLHITDPGHDAELDGSYNGLSFELPRTLLTDLQGTWEKK